MLTILLQFVVLALPMAALLMWVGSRFGWCRANFDTLLFGAVGLLVAGHVASDVNTMFVYPVQLQQSLLGRQVVGPGDLIAIDDIDAGIQIQTYRLPPATTQALMHRCRAHSTERVSGECTFGSRFNGMDSVDTVTVASNDTLVLTAFR